MTQHTPGPWKISLAGIIFAEPSPEDPQDTVTIVDAYSATPANARLIAAAPEMLALVKDWAHDTCWSKGFPELNAKGEPQPNMCSAASLCTPCRARALLARIEGKE